MNTVSSRKQIVVIGAGFAGLTFCQSAAGLDADITLIDRQNHHLFQPLLYQVATSGLSAPEIAQPIRRILARQKNVRVLLDEVTQLDLKAKTVTLKNSREEPLSYDYLILAMGARTSYYGNPEWERFAPGLKSLDDARLIRHNVLLAFEKAEADPDPVARQRYMTIVVVGGGPTGVELAGSFAELSRQVLHREFRLIDPSAARVILLEASPRILGAFDPSLSEKGEKQLRSLGVDVRTNQKILSVEPGKITTEAGVIEAANIVWGAGIAASPLCRQLGIPLGRGDRVEVAPDLSVPGHPEVFALGDIVSLKDKNGKIVPGVSPAAMQMGRHAARLIRDELKRQAAPGSVSRAAFAYLDKGSMATIGRSRAVAQVGKLKFSGMVAWQMWLFVHLLFLIGFRNKLAVLLQWFYGYVTFRRGARLITGRDKTFIVK